MSTTTQETWRQWKDIDNIDDVMGPVHEVNTPSAVVRFTDKTDLRSVYTKFGQDKPTLTFGAKEPKHISMEDGLIPEITALDSAAFCETAQYVRDCAVAVDTYDVEAKRAVSQDYERVIEAARVRAAQGVINMDEADAVVSMYEGVVRGSGVEMRMLRQELPA